MIFFKKKPYEERLYKALTKQKEELEKEWQEKEDRLVEIHNQNINLLCQEHQAEKRVLEDELRSWKERKKEVENREYRSKMQIKANRSVAMSIVTKTKEISLMITKGVAELDAIFQEADDHNDKIKEISNGS